ncbi:uncharacterized protein BJX67DRAFT_164421 [Aspergillus lucknowensis]|uniref:RING-type domain-containing protein n=1 Tax=Aspergillus lucknowensis TaxID=176173 RepID=A0ABR4M4M3_9EURO
MPIKPKKKKAHNQKGQTSNSDGLPRGSEVDNSTTEITKELANTLHIEDSQRVEIPLREKPVNEPVNKPVQEPGKQNLAVTGSPKEGSFRRRIRALTSSSTKSSTGVNRQSWESQSSSATSSRVLSASLRDSATTQEGNPPEGITQSPTSKKKRNKKTSPKKTAAAPGVMRYIRSPHDYMFIDLDQLESQAMNNGLDSGAPGGGANEKSDGGQPPEPNNMSSFDELIAYIRHATGTETKPISLTDPNVPRRQGDARAWDYRNLWCISCRGPCPICNTTCCLREEALQKASDGTLNAEEVEKAKRFAKIIERLGAYAKDASTFSQCSPPDGCGRHVCPDCCGVCPSQICRGIQCKECKPKPWDNCDWPE